jgi:hypothetical protein
VKVSKCDKRTELLAAYQVHIDKSGSSFTRKLLRLKKRVGDLSEEPEYVYYRAMFLTYLDAIIKQLAYYKDAYYCIPEWGEYRAKQSYHTDLGPEEDILWGEFLVEKVDERFIAFLDASWRHRIASFRDNLYKIEPEDSDQSSEYDTSQQEDDEDDDDENTPDIGTDTIEELADHLLSQAARVENASTMPTSQANGGVSQDQLREEDQVEGQGGVVEIPTEEVKMSEEEAKKLEDAHFVSSGDKSDHPSQQ